MKKNSGKFGINMKQWCRDHEAAVTAAIESSMATDKEAEMEADPITPEMISTHKEKILILQHERLAHLMVTVMVVFVELFVVYLALVHPELGILPAIVMLCLAVLLGFYFYHYFFLENTLQRWYKLTEELEKRKQH